MVAGVVFLLIMAGRGYSKLAERMNFFRSTTGTVLERSVVPFRQVTHALELSAMAA